MGDGKISMANGIFSKYPIISTSYQWINEASGTGRYDDEYRAYIEATLDIEGFEVTVATTHMSYTNAFVSTSRKQQETLRLVALLRSKQSRFIFTGDLNATTDSPTIRAVSNVLRNIGPVPEKSTWTTKPFSYDGFEETELKWRLDYVFTSYDVKTISAKILDTVYSDHLPILAEVEL